jgi:hypothetical protein
MKKSGVKPHQVDEQVAMSALGVRRDKAHAEISRSLTLEQ